MNGLTDPAKMPNKAGGWCCIISRLDPSGLRKAKTMLEAYLPGGKLAGLVSQCGGKRIFLPLQTAFRESSHSRSLEEGTEPSGRRRMGTPLRMTWRKPETGTPCTPRPKGKQRMLSKTEISSGEGEP